MELEGLRGLAALAVVLGHYIFAFYPALVTGNMHFQHMRFEDNIYGTPLAVVFSGGFAVAIFFVLSGFVLTIGFFQTKKTEVIKKLASKRYIRLMLPALASILICLVFMKTGFAGIDHAAHLTHSKWLDSAWRIDGGVINALIHGAVGIFTEGTSPYNNVLWTMKTEFLGSFMIFGFVLLFAESRFRWISYLVLSALTFNTWFLAFVVGAALADLYSANIIGRFKNKYLISGLAIAGVLLGSFPAHAAGTVYGLLMPSFLSQNVDFSVLYLTSGAMLVVLAAISGNRITRALKAPKVSILGKYTFSLYLIHLPILYIFTTNLFVKLQSSFGYNKAVAMSLLLSAPVIWAMTMLFEKYIDAPSITFAKRVADVYMGKVEFDWRQRSALTIESIRFRWEIAKGKVMTELRRSEDLES